jgi:hypothetical protein
VARSDELPGSINGRRCFEWLNDRQRMYVGVCCWCCLQDAVGETTLINMLRRDAAAVVPSYRSARRHRLPAFVAARYSWRQIRYCDSLPIHCDVMIVSQCLGVGGTLRVILCLECFVRLTCRLIAPACGAADCASCCTD